MILFSTDRTNFDGLRPVLPCLLIFAILVTTLDTQSLWWDEGISLHLATSSWAEIIADRAANIHPPLYFFALKVWVSLVGHTPFAARYLSSLGATLLPAAVYIFIRRRMDRRTGRAAALLVALAPPFVIYGQEVRAYAFLPLLALALLAQVWPASSVFLPRSALRAQRRIRKLSALSDLGGGISSQRARCVTIESSSEKPAAYYNPLLLALIQTAFVLTHYAGVIAVVWANFVLLLRLIRSKDRRAWRRWLFSVALTALLATPWVTLVLLTGAAGLKTEAGLGNVLDEPIPAAYLARLLGIFHTVGLPEAMTDPLLTRPSVLLGSLLLIALVVANLRIGESANRRTTQRLDYLTTRLPDHSTSRLVIVWLLPLLTAALMWVLSPQSHPRYVLPFVMGGWLLAAALTTARTVPRGVRVALLATILTTSLLGLRAYLTEPAYARSDVRGAAAYIRAVALPGDGAFAPHTDWSLEQYDVGAAYLVNLPSPADDHAVAAVLRDVVRSNSHVYLLDYQRNALDPRGQVRANLAWGGWLEGRETFHGVFVERYVLSAAPVLPDCAPIPAACVQGASPCLVGAAFLTMPVSGAALPVSLCWDGAPAPTRYAVALRLYAQNGALVAGADTRLLDGALRTTELWSTGPVTTYHLIPLPAGLLPRAYRLEVGVYPLTEDAIPVSLVREGAPPVPALALGEVTPVVAPWVAAGAAETAPVTLSGLRLYTATLSANALYPGQILYVTSRWQVTADGVNPTGVRLVLRQGERDLASTMLFEGLPALPEGRPLLEHSAVLVPPDAEDGAATVIAVGDDRQVEIGAVTLHVGERSFVVPPVTYPVDAQAGDVATLPGMDIEPGLVLRSGEPFTVTLIWRAGKDAAWQDLTVFTHLVGADGNIVAQHDGKPVNGLRPTSGWLAGEILVDAHVLTWQRPYAGPATLRLGLYDASTGVRVLWANGADMWEFSKSLTVQ
ncbi:MAG TPA: glycosyltransferase family 39 protein [Anaerolineae bacterium]|nr:glycosyltransferase family 39 protein [Anaerolineae bacterium]HQK12945.1 glycosyltransferase family 39 protein [Anaerolineae bacterium]